MTLHQPWLRNFVNAPLAWEPGGKASVHQLTELPIKKLGIFGEARNGVTTCLVFGDV